MNLKAIIFDTASFVAFVRVIVSFAFRAALYFVAIGALCLASVIKATGLMATSELATLILVILAATAFLAAHQMTRLSRRARDDGGIRFCEPHRGYDEPTAWGGQQ